MKPLSNDPLLQPLQIKHLTLRNRIFSTAHAPLYYLEDNGVPGEKYAMYTEEKAKGGVGLTIIGGSSNVAIDSANVFDNFDAFDPRVVDFYRDVSRRVHGHGAAIMVQITHLGRRSVDVRGDWLPTVSPSAIRERAHRSFPKEMEDFDFERLVRAYGDAAALAKEGGLDGVQVQASAGHLIDQFFATRTNARDDEYSLATGKLKFALDVLREVRRRVGDDFIVGVKIAGDEGAEGGVRLSESIEIARALGASGLVDFLDVIYGSGYNDAELADIISGFGRAQGEHLGMAGSIRAAVDLPVFHAGRIADLATARHALREGFVDAVGMTRAHIADPHIVTKLLAGKEDDIRPCVGALSCMSPNGTYCVHNPATGREQYIPQLIQPTSGRIERVVVVGGGPAGLEAARVCAERGHEVTLLEAADVLGGQLLLASRSHRHSEKAAIIHWLAAQVKAAGATVRLNTYADAADVLQLDPTVVIVATGGMPNTDVLDEGNEYAESTWDAVGSSRTTDGSVLVYDDHGTEQAALAAEHLAGLGARVELVTPDRTPLQDVVPLLTPDYLRALYGKGVVLTADHELVTARKEGTALRLELRNVFTGEIQERTVERLVVEHGTLPVTEVYDELRSKSVNGGQTDLAAFAKGARQPTLDAPTGSIALFRIGDAVAHRGIQAAIFDARRLCMNL
ncbi:oxidoreductase [Geodermatophilus sp. URMC 64]